MHEVKQVFGRYYPFLLFLLIYIGIFYKVFIYHLVPFPGDLLVSFFFPYNSGGWEGYTPWISHKGFIAADVVRQLYAWRTLSIELMKQGIWPFWNPYQLAGSPLMPNVQNAALYPFNFIFFLVNEKLAWVIYIMLEPILSFCFMYLFIRSLKLSKFAATLSGLAYPFMGVMTTQFEWGTVVHSYAYIPLVLYGMTKFFDTGKRQFLFISLFGIVFSLLSGYVQPTVYLLMIAITYFVYWMVRKYKTQGKKIALHIFDLWFIPLAFGIAALQLLPTWREFALSARGSNLQVLFHQFQFPYVHLVTLFASDFFGNSATGNFWGITDYAENNTFVGVVILFFAFAAIWYQRKNANVIYFFILGITGLLFALPTPFSELLLTFNVPVLSSGVPARATFLLQFGLVVLAGFGLDYFLQAKKRITIPIIIFALVYCSLWLVVLLTPHVFESSLLSQHISVAKHNLILPSIVAFLVCMLVLLKPVLEKQKTALFVILLLIAGCEYGYFLNKYASFSPMQYMFPKQVLVTHLQQIVGNDRIYGYDTAYISPNLPTQWRIQYPEVFDSFYPKEYGQLIESTKNGSFVANPPRSDVNFPNTLPRDDSYAKQVALNLIDVKYVLDKDDNPANPFDPRPDRFPQDRFKLIWQQGKYKIYENLKALPRASIYYQWQVLPNDKQAVETIYKKTFDYRNTLLIENPVKITPKNLHADAATITNYQTNTVTLSVNAKADGFVFLPDTYYPSWRATVDGKNIQILRANHAFRAVRVSKGNHTVIFYYGAKYFRMGVVITIISLVITVLLFAVIMLTRTKIKKH